MEKPLVYDLPMSTTAPPFCSNNRSRLFIDISHSCSMVSACWEGLCLEPQFGQQDIDQGYIALQQPINSVSFAFLSATTILPP